MTEALRTQIRLKTSKYKEYVKSNNVDIVESYKDSKRILHPSLRNAEIQYYSEQYELNSGDMFKSWKVLKTILALNAILRKDNFVLQLTMWLLPTARTLLMALMIFLFQLVLSSPRTFTLT